MILPAVLWLPCALLLFTRLRPEQDSCGLQDEGLYKPVHVVCRGACCMGLLPVKRGLREGWEEKGLVLAQLPAKDLKFPAAACL